jgi:hemerythrin
MAFYEWKPEFSVQVLRFDEQHKKLIQLINHLHDSMKAGQAVAQMASILNELDSYTQKHFREEEILMERYQYPGLPAQKQSHALFIKKIAEFKDEFSKGKLSTPLNVMAFLKDWLTRHILETDKQYGPFFSGKGAV